MLGVFRNINDPARGGCLKFKLCIYTRIKVLRDCKRKFQVTLRAKMATYNSQQYPWNLYLIKNVKANVLDHLKVPNYDNSNMCSCSRNAKVTFLEKPQLNSFQDHKHSYLILTHPLVCPCFKLTSLIEHASGDDQFDTKRQSDKQSKEIKLLVRLQFSYSFYVQLLILRSATHFTFSYSFYVQLLILRSPTHFTFSYSFYVHLFILRSATHFTYSYSFYVQLLILRL